ncbi:MAG: starch phosphorylase [Verrucomicrobiales bacterium]|jgi:starch phosphorylase
MHSTAHSLEPVSPSTGQPVADTAESLKQAIVDHLRHTLAHNPDTALPRDWWQALCLAVRDRIMDRASKTRTAQRDQNCRRVYYLSMEYLMGRLLSNNLRNLDIWNDAEIALKEFGQSLDQLVDEEPDMGLGNGGLGRLAACFLDSLATLEYPAIGYGMHYEFGLFRQEFVDNTQIEHADIWARFGNPWEIQRPDYAVEVQLYGQVEKGKWEPTKSVMGVPTDIPIIGYGCETVNVLRLWQARASEEFNFQTFNDGGYVEAVREKAESESISKVLYPNDNTAVGQELRLVQEYFFVACSLKDIIRRHTELGNNWENFAEKAAIQLNDTHPAVAVIELMRIMVDESGLEWNKAWEICEKTFSYTNHTLLPEALECWSVPLFKKVLPRHLEIVFRINKWFLEEVVDKKWPGDGSKRQALSLIANGNPDMIRMAYLSVVVSHTTNGVAALHTRLLKERLFADFNELYPGKIQNKTNGITPRRWLKACNPELSALIDEKIGDDWPSNLDRLQELGNHADDADFQTAFMAIKHRNKERLASMIHELCGIEVSPDALFDVQIKRLHEYKRQHLNLLHILTLYRRLLDNPDLDITPRVFIFGAKAAPGYTLAKHIIHCINAVAEKINHDERIGGKLKIAFLPNYGVSIAEVIIPAADLSEQISTAGKEASGTGNMKLALNGALTIGTLDGANVEILEEVGDDNIFIFGLNVEEAQQLLAAGYAPRAYYNRIDELRNVIDWLDSGEFTEDRQATSAFKHSLLDGGDSFLVLADYEAYIASQAEVDLAFRDKSSWAKKAILNTARVGKFSSDRTIREYAEEIWNLRPVPVA